MTEYFRADTSRYDRRMKYILLILLLPVLLGSVISVLILLLNLRVFLLSGIAYYIAGAVAASVFFAIPVCWIVVWKCSKAAKRNTRYTFIGIGKSELVFNRYMGEYICRGERIILQRTVIIPLKHLDNIKINVKSEKLLIISKDSAIRSYTGRSDRLGYCFNDGGRVVFDDWWLNENCYKSLSELVIPAVFGNAEALGNSLAEAKKQFNLLPEKKPYVHKELDFVRKKKAAEALKRLNF